MCFFELSFDIFVKRDQSPKTVCGGRGGCYESTHNASFSGVIFALKMVVLHFLHSIMGILCPMHWEKCVYFIFHFSLMVWHYFLNFFFFFFILVYYLSNLFSFSFLLGVSFESDMLPWKFSHYIALFTSFFSFSFFFSRLLRFFFF
jgi:hypothetical protein